MKKIVWDKKYNVGNETIDSQHQHLVKLINIMIDERENLSKDVIKAIFNQLIHYANVHFHDEEELINKSQYPNKIEHKKLHRDFTKKLDEIEIDIVLENPKVVDEIIDFLTFWLIDHILVSDKDFAPFLYKEEIL